MPTPTHSLPPKPMTDPRAIEGMERNGKVSPFLRATSGSRWSSVLLWFPCGELRLNCGECCVQTWRCWVLGLGPHHQSEKETLSPTFLEEGAPAPMVASPVPLVSDVSGVLRGIWGNQSTQTLGTCLPLLNLAKLWGNFHTRCLWFCGKNGELK